MRRFNLRFEQVTDGGDASGYAPKGDDQTTPPTEQKTAPPPEKEGSNLDEYGYEKPTAPDESGKKADGAKEKGKETPPKDEKKEVIKDPISGYGDNPPEEVDDSSVEIPPKEEKKEDDLGFELEAKDLDAKEVEKIKTFAKTHKLTKEVAQAFIELKKTEVASQKAAEEADTKAFKAAIAAQKSKWHKELQDDPKFGKEKFAHNVMRAEKVLSEFMGETKKVLTERKSMLPPYVMRDLAKLADHLFESDTLVQGDAGRAESKEKDDKETSPLDFYT